MELNSRFKKAFTENGFDVHCFDFDKGFRNKFNNKYVSKLPAKYRSRIDENRTKKINDAYMLAIEDYSPDLVIIYNDSHFTQENINKIQKKSNVFFYLGDSPLFLTYGENIMPAILSGNHIFSPDTYWLEQLKLLGYNNCSYLLPPFESDYYYDLKLSDSEKGNHSTDIVYFGSGGGYGSMTYKRGLFLSKFCSFDFKLYSSNPDRMIKYFPQLKNNVIRTNGYISYEESNLIMNCANIYPVDANPTIINGIHTRVFDCVSSGVLPLTEYRKDFDFLFKDISYPYIKDYNDIPLITRKYLDDSKHITEIVNGLKEFFSSEFSGNSFVKNVMNVL